MVICGLARIHVAQCSSSIFTLEVTLLVLAGGVRRSRNHLAYVVMSDLTARGRRSASCVAYCERGGAAERVLEYSYAFRSVTPRLGRRLCIA